MKIAVCVRQDPQGELSPFDACAYEAALRIDGAEVVLVSMGPPSAESFLCGLTRLGAEHAVLLTDPAFAGADTLATAYTLSLAIKKLKPDLIFCGRQTLVGDTAQVGPMLSVYAETSLISGVMSIDSLTADRIICTTREQGVISAKFPALITVERINTLRLPSIRSKLGHVELYNVEKLGADVSRCGLTGSPTRVIKTYENHSGKRKCRFIEPYELYDVISTESDAKKHELKKSKLRLDSVFSVGNELLAHANAISDNVTVLEMTDAASIAKHIELQKPDAVLWTGDAWGRETAAKVAAMLGLGLCADCTGLEIDEGQLIMYRPARAGSVIAKILSNTRPAMATVRTEKRSGDIVVAAGYGTAEHMDAVKAVAERLGAELAASRKAVDNGLLPYDAQVGLTGKTICPAVYIAAGISGAVHHLVGMQRAGMVIAINPDRNAPIFEYADYGILCGIEELLKK